MIKAKAKEVMITIGKYAGTYRFVLSPELYTTLTEETVVKEAALRSGMSPHTIVAAYNGIADTLRVWATNGHCVPIPGLGSMRFGLRADSVADVADVKSSLITARRVIFTPSVPIKEELAKTSISITCYDRYGKVIKTVSNNDGTVEDPEPDTTFTLEVVASPAQGGTVTGSGTYNDEEIADLTATPNSGYKFVSWNDGDTNASRTVSVTADATYTATFVSEAGGSGDDEFEG